MSEIEENPISNLYKKTIDQLRTLSAIFQKTDFKPL